jgi:hypothetical protein
MKKTHGGARKGAGRKRKEPTKTIRVPVSLIPQIKKLIHEKANLNSDSI